MNVVQCVWWVNGERFVFDPTAYDHPYIMSVGHEAILKDLDGVDGDLHLRVAVIFEPCLEPVRVPDDPGALEQ